MRATHRNFSPSGLETVTANLSGTANDRLRQRFDSVLWSSMIVATAVHAAVFAFWPQVQVEDWSGPTDGPKVVDVGLKVDIPSEPPPVARPATPVISTEPLPSTATVPPNTWASVDPAQLPPPPAARSGLDQGASSLVPITVRPRLLNPAEVERALTRRYPADLREAGIGGLVRVEVLVRVDGSVGDTRVAQSSGVEGLDAAAKEVARAMRFSPAMNRDLRLAVWIVLPIEFHVRGPSHV